jgi:hypothetical protein
MSKPLPIEPGQRFRSVAGELVWTVAEIFDDPCGQSHTRLVLVGDRWTRKTISCALLQDPDEFLPLGVAGRRDPPRLGLFGRRRVA